MRSVVIFILVGFYLPFLVNGQNSLDDLNIILKHDFENNTVGDYLENEWNRDWLNPVANQHQSETDVVQDENDAVNSSKTLQINYAAGTVGEANSGASWHILFNKMDELYVSYDFMFMPGFQFQLGGKMPSVQGGSITAGVKPNGYDGFTGGLMFHKDGFLYSYIYYPDSKNPEYGDSFIWGGNNYPADYFSPSKVSVDFGSGDLSVCTPGEWHNITYRLVMNTVKSEGGGNYDGIMEAFFDGKLVTQLSHILFRHTTDIGIDLMRLYSFFGGSGDEWKTPIDEWLRLDNVILFTFNDNIDVPRGNTLSPTNRTINYWRKMSTGNVNVDIPALPGIPSLTSQTNSSISIKWSDNSGNENGFKIYRSLDQYLEFVEVGSVASNVTSFTDNSIQPSIQYYYRVRSYNDAGYSNYTGALSVKVQSVELPELPYSPTKLTAIEVQYTRAVINWTDNSDNETGFEIERSGPDDFGIKTTFTVSGNVTDFTDDGLEMNKAYQYRVRAFNNDGFSAYSNAIQVITPVIKPPVAPTLLKSTDFTDKSITVSWDDNSDNESGFVILRALAEEPENSVSINIDANDTLFMDTELHSSTSYIYTIKAFNIAGNSPSSNKKVASTLSVAETKRCKDGLIAYYNFGYDPDYVIHDLSGYGEPLDLRVLQPKSVSWDDQKKLEILSNTAMVSYTPAKKIITAVKVSNEITIECWMKPVEPDIPADARIISLASSDEEIGILMDQDFTETSDTRNLNYCVRMQTESTNPAGYPEFIPDISNTQFISLQHIVYVRDKLGKEKMYINGIPSSEGFRPSDLSSWGDDFYLRLGNESDLNHPWMGTFYSVAFYDKALTNNQVNRNFSLGPCDSVQQKGLDYQINVTPNPITDLAQIEIIPLEFEDIAAQTTIRVLDMFGKVYYQRMLLNPNNQYTETIDFKNFQRGIYLLQVISGSKQRSAKLIVR